MVGGQFAELNKKKKAHKQQNRSKYGEVLPDGDL